MRRFKQMTPQQQTFVISACIEKAAGDKKAAQDLRKLITKEDSTKNRILSQGILQLEAQAAMGDELAEFFS